nr:auxin response factor 2-like isoform X2 [Ipomoea batatas]
MRVLEARTTKVFDLASNLGHRRALVGVLSGAINRELQELNHVLLDVLVPEELEIKHLSTPLLPDDGLHPSWQINAFLVRQRVSRSLPRKQLEEQHAKTINIGFLGYLTRVCYLGRPIAIHTVRRGRGADELSKAKVRNTTLVGFGTLTSLSLFTTIVNPISRTALYAVPKVPFPSTSAEAFNRSSKSKLRGVLVKNTKCFPLPPAMASAFPFSFSLAPNAASPPPRVPAGFSGGISISVCLFAAAADLGSFSPLFRHRKNRRRRINRNPTTQPITIPAIAPPESFFLLLDCPPPPPQRSSGGPQMGHKTGRRIHWNGFSGSPTMTVKVKPSSNKRESKESVPVLHLLQAIVELVDADDEAGDGVEEPVKDEGGGDEEGVALRLHDRLLVAEVLRGRTRIRRFTGGPCLVLPVDIHQEEEAEGDDRHEGFEEVAGHGDEALPERVDARKGETSATEFIIPYDLESLKNKFSIGMRFKMRFEGEEAPEQRFIGTIVGIEDHDPHKWPKSKWRCLKVQWDDTSTISRPDRFAGNIDVPNFRLLGTGILRYSDGEDAIVDLSFDLIHLHSLRQLNFPFAGNIDVPNFRLLGTGILRYSDGEDAIVDLSFDLIHLHSLRQLNFPESDAKCLEDSADLSSTLEKIEEMESCIWALS